MDEDVLNMSLRKFLKKVGVTGQREIEQAVRNALDAGRLKGDEKLPAAMRLTIPAVGLDVVIDGGLRYFAAVATQGGFEVSPDVLRAPIADAASNLAGELAVSLFEHRA